MTVLNVALDLLREAGSRKWFLLLGLFITLVLLALGLSLRLEVVDGALAATRLFGKSLGTDIQSVDVALRPVYVAVAYLTFYGGMVFGILSCADFAPAMLTPGRIEQLLSLPVRRWELLLGTFLGVMALALGAALYGAGGLALLLGFKTGAWTLKPVAAALLSMTGFAAVYACMLSVALFLRSASVSALFGGLVFVAGIAAGFRTEIAAALDEGLTRSLFEAVTAALPRLSTLATASAELAGSGAVTVKSFPSVVAGVATWALGALCVGIWRFEHKDF
jgi:Cu-processing system permease protein